MKRYCAGDFFGETALVTGQPRSADVRARTDLDALAVDKNDFLGFVRGTDLAEALIGLARNRDLPSWDLIGEKPVLGLLGAKERTHLQAVLEHTPLAAGQLLWSAGEIAASGWLLDDALVELATAGAHRPGRRDADGRASGVVRGMRVRVRG